MGGLKYSVGTGERPSSVLAPHAPGLYYQIGKDIKDYTLGKTMGYQFEVPKNKDIEDFPAPNKYNARYP